MKLKSIALGAIVLMVISCEENKENHVLEVTTFRLNPTVSQDAFNTLDGEVETNFTSKQPGFIKRQSGVDDDGNYVVLVYWNTMADAESSMSKFMSDSSVAEYTGMIDGGSMTMNRYMIHEEFAANSSSFIEVMEFDLAADANPEKFDKVNEQVAIRVTAPKEGFVQRITGANEKGGKAVVIYWDTKGNSDAALKPFMKNPISQEFMGMMDQSSVVMYRCATLESL